MLRAINAWLDKTEKRLGKYFYKINREIQTPIRIFPIKKLKALSLAMRQVALPIDGTAVNMEAWHNAVNNQYKIIRLISRPTNRFMGKRPYTTQQAKALLVFVDANPNDRVMINPDILYKMLTGQHIEDPVITFDICPDLTNIFKNPKYHRTSAETYSLGLLTAFSIRERGLSSVEKDTFYQNNPLLKDCVNELRYSRYQVPNI